jgi:hypothetical protein
MELMPFAEIVKAYAMVRRAHNEPHSEPVPAGSFASLGSPAPMTRLAAARNPMFEGDQHLHPNHHGR